MRFSIVRSNSGDPPSYPLVGSRHPTAEKKTSTDANGAFAIVVVVILVMLSTILASIDLIMRNMFMHLNLRNCECEILVMPFKHC